MSNEALWLVRFWFVGIVLGLCFAYLLVRGREEAHRLTIFTQDQQEWIAGTCKERGRRTIIINEENNQLTVKCKGPGVHLYDASGRK